MRSGLAISLTSSLALIERFDYYDGQVEELGNELVIQKSKSLRLIWSCLSLQLSHSMTHDLRLAERKEALKLNHHKNITSIPAPAFDLFTTRWQSDIMHLFPRMFRSTLHPRRRESVCIPPLWQKSAAKGPATSPPQDAYTTPHELLRQFCGRQVSRRHFVHQHNRIYKVSVRLHHKQRVVYILVSSIFVRYCCRLDDVRCRWFSNPRIQ